MTIYRSVRRLAAIAVLAGFALAACGAPADRPAVATATVVADGEPVPGALVELRLLDGSAASVVADSTGRFRLELAGARGPGILEVARDTVGARIGRLYAPVLVEPGDSVVLALDMGESRGHQARYLNGSLMARWGRAVQFVDAIEMDHYEAYEDWVAGGQRGELVVDWRGTIDSVRAALAREEDPEVRSALWVALLTAGVRGAPMTAKQADRALQGLDPGAAVWEWRPWSAPSLVEYAAAKAEGAAEGIGETDGQALAGRRELAARRTAAYLDRMAEAQSEPRVRAPVLLGAMRLAEASGRREDAVAYYRRLVERYPESDAARLAEREAPGSGLDVGSPVPAVALPALDSTAPPITPEQLAGPATLIDFWAAWCTPCVAEMPAIHEAYERFRGRGFDVVSVSFDASRDDVRRFRDRYPMPWRHAFAGAEALSDGEVAAAYGINGLPFAVLVGPDGTILALEGELRGERLAETLERVLGESDRDVGAGMRVGGPNPGPTG